MNTSRSSDPARRIKTISIKPPFTTERRIFPCPDPEDRMKPRFTFL